MRSPSRNKDTDYSQYIARVELELYQKRRPYFDRVVEAAWMVDERIWKKFHTEKSLAVPKLSKLSTLTMMSKDSDGRDRSASMLTTTQPSQSYACSPQRRSILVAATAFL